jgi:hypothetical protein
VAQQHNHYEAAFQAWLHWFQVPYVAVNESHRTRVGSRTLKSVDFIVSPVDATRSWLVDVKGRRFPTGSTYWKNWSTADELQSLAAWESVFGSRFAGLLVFAYNVIGDRAPLPADELFVFRGGIYGFVAMQLDHYTSWSRPLSRRWGTVSVPVPQFRALARPARELLGVKQPQFA